ncbi:hypothetical protein QBC43DRAFT_313485 [Cladorrhinum sp. PSN259]|nr:hypothetical protein QBC43DRAFT_313485 [Cladorrhinum sp. PSN259]
MEVTSIDQAGGPRLNARSRRRWEADTLRAKAPLAAQFEDCAEAIKQLHAALNAHTSVSEQELPTQQKESHEFANSDNTAQCEREPSKVDPLRILVDKCQQRLKSWGHDTGASSRLLDHSLRWSSKPRNSTLTLLKELHGLVVQATEALPAAFDGYGETPQEDGPSREEQKKEIFEILGLHDEEPEPAHDDSRLNPERYLAEADEILDDLFHLSSVLLEPYDDEHPEPLPDSLVENEIREDRDYTRQNFVKAPKFLVERLMAANRRRRENIYALRKNEETYLSQSVEVDAKSAISGPVAVIRAKDGGVQGRPKKKRTRAPRSRISGYRKTKTRSESETGASKTAPSSVTATGKSSLFSRDVIYEQESVTSLTMSSTGPLPVVELRPPPAPVNLKAVNHKFNPPRNPYLPFRCQFCAFDVPLEPEKGIMTPDEWVTHFFLDLQPYICTFEECSRAQKLFGLKQQWWEHEVDYHRTHGEQAWYCALPECKLEIETRTLFEDHLKSQHPDLVHLKSPEVLSMIIDSCQQPSSKQQSQVLIARQECSFCGFVYEEKPTRLSVRDHIAHHLEQFALLAIGEEQDDASSENEVDPNERVSEYLEGVTVTLPLKKNLNIEEPAISQTITVPEEQNTTIIQPSVVPEESNNLRDISNSSGLGDSNGAERAPRQTSGNLWKDKVQTYLSKDTEEDIETGHSAGSEVTSRLPIMQEASSSRNEGPLTREDDVSRFSNDTTESGVTEQPEKPTPEPVWHKVPKRNAEFVGRENDLYRLKHFIGQPGHICVISGVGGIGKTATAVEYSRRFGHVYSHILWIDAETSGSLDDQYGSIGTEVFALVGPESEQDPVSFSITVRSQLGGWNNRWLLILDNVEAWKDISRYIPRNLAKGQGSVLITTRLQSLIEADKPTLQQVLHRIKLEPLSSEEAGQFLLCSIDNRVAAVDAPKHPDHGLAVKIAQLVDRLPLALIMVSGYVKVSRATLEDFLEIWEEKTAFRAKQAKRPDGEPKRWWVSDGRLDSSIDLLWDIGISELPNPARNLLEIMAFLDPENIQKDLLVRDHGEHYLEFLNSTETALYQRMIRHLAGRKLIEIKEREENGVKTEAYRIHRLLQEKIVMEVGVQLKFDSAMRKATRLVRKVFPKAPVIQEPAPQNWKACKSYMPHIYSLNRAFKAASALFPGFQRTEELADLFYDAGFYIWDRQQTESDGLDFLETAEKILDKLGVDSNSPRRADIHCMCGLLRNTMGCQYRDESFTRLQLALDIRKHLFRSQDYDRTRDVLFQNAGTDFAILLLNRYDFEQAELIFTKCLERYRSWDTEDKIPFEYSKYYYNMGIVRVCQGKLEEATRLLQRSVELTERAFGKQSQYWANYFMLACSIRLSGDVQRALEMHLEILKANITQMGKHSKSTILSTFAVGVMYRYVGDFPKAIEYMEECVHLAKASNTWTEEALGRAQALLARLYTECGVKLKKASELQAMADKVRAKYVKYASEWVVSVGDQFAIFDDLQPTDEGRYTGSLLLQILWARQRGEKVGTFTSAWGRQVTVSTGL